MLQEDVEAGRTPGVALAVSRRGGPVEQVVRPLAVDTLFPVASITKLATALAVLRLAHAGELAPDDELLVQAASAPPPQASATGRCPVTRQAPS